MSENPGTSTVCACMVLGQTGHLLLVCSILVASSALQPGPPLHDSESKGTPIVRHNNSSMSVRAVYSCN